MIITGRYNLVLQKQAMLSLFVDIVVLLNVAT